LTCKNNLLSDQQIRDFAQQLVEEQNTMTIATALKDMAWAAPVYYASIEFDFYFFSDPASRHIKESMQNGQASAAIFAAALTWKDIRGVQMSGSISQRSPGLASLRALRAYLKKFPFTKEFFTGDQQLTLDAFIKTFRVHLYRFRPTLLYYVDNKIRFSFRQKVHLAEVGDNL